jgi:hypothetical protein
MAGHVARIEEMRSAYKTLSENLKIREHLEDLGLDGTVVLE